MVDKKKQKSAIEIILEKRQKEKKLQEIKPLEHPEEQTAPLVAKVKSPAYRKYLICPFCETKQYDQTGIDQGSSWCIQCGKAFMVDWKQENT